MHINHTRSFNCALFLAAVFLTACGGGGGSPPPAGTTSYTIGGTITGLTSGKTLILRNGSEDLTINGAATAFTFSNGLADGATYSVSVPAFGQPAGLNCVVTNGSGTIAAANVNTVSVACSTATYTIGGTVSGMTATPLVLIENIYGEVLNVNSDGNFAFTNKLAGSVTYNVTVQTPPAGQTCMVSNGSGAVNNANVTGIVVTCAAMTYSIGGNISGLTSTGLILKNNNTDDLAVPAASSVFAFPTKLVDGAAYSVTVSANPSGKTCTANNNTGNVPGANVTNVSVLCSAITYSVGGNVTGLTGSGLVLQNNSGNDLNVPAASGVYAFTQIAEGSNYSVTVKTQPSSPAQVCTIAPAGTGTNILANVTTANVSCVNAYTISGTITGAADGIGPILQNNGGDNLFIPTVASGVPTSFTFSTPVAEGATYAVTQLSKGRAPPQDCSTTNGSGTVGAGPVSGVAFTCTLSSAPAARFAYVTNSTADISTTVAPDTVSAYTIAASGVLAASTTPTTPSGNQPFAVAVDPAGQFAYVVNAGSDSITAYSINASNGALTALNDVDGGTTGDQVKISTGDNPKSIAIHPSGGFAYVANQLIGIPGTLSAYSLNTTSGALSAIDADAAPGVQATIATGTAPYAVSVDPFGKFVYVANYDDDKISAYSINQASGALTPVGSPVPAGNKPSSIAVDPTGRCALVTNNGVLSDNVMSYTIDSGTGALTLVTTTTAIASSAPRSVAIDPATGQYAYVANAGGSVSAFSITPATCAITEIDADIGTAGMTMAAGTTPFSVNVDPSGQFVYVANLSSNNVSVYSIGGGGALTLLQTIATGSGPTSVTTTQ